jgi:DNA-binding LacI/PurR family transcriptional regulator
LRNRLRKPVSKKFQELTLIRIRDIAERAGVSVTTVSHVLNKSRRVHPETESRVLQAIQDLDYRPNMLARSLRRHETHTIGLLVSDINNKYFTDVARAVETAAYNRGYNMILCNTNEDQTKEAMYFNVLLAKQVDGLIVAPAPGDHTYIQNHIQHGACMVLVNRYLSDVQAPAVVCDDEEAAYHLLDSLLAAGHRRVGAIIGHENVSTTQDRLNGLYRAAAQHALPSNDLWIYPAQSRQEGGYHAAQEIAKMIAPPTSVISFNSVMMDGFLLGLVDHAPHLIKEIEFTGFGYSHLARVFRPNGKYISQPAQQVGATATKLLLDFLTGAAAWNTEKVVLHNSIVSFQPEVAVNLQPDQSLNTNQPSPLF